MKRRGVQVSRPKGREDAESGGVAPGTLSVVKCEVHSVAVTSASLPGTFVPVRNISSLLSAASGGTINMWK